MLKIVTAPNPILSGNSKPVKKIDKFILNLIRGMGKTLLAAKDPEGVGLAAPQVGKLLQIFITKPSPKSPIQVFINPVITLNSADPNADKRPKTTQRKSASRSAKISDSSKKLEGCLSLPNIWGEVNRPPIITLFYLDRNGGIHTKTFKGLFSTIIQHEIDHLNGILFPKRVLEQKGTLYKSHKDEKGEDVFEEIEL